jgi:hypothetical protein
MRLAGFAHRVHLRTRSVRRTAPLLLLLLLGACDGPGGGCARTARVAGPTIRASVARDASRLPDAPASTVARATSEPAPSIRVEVVDAGTGAPLAATAVGLVYAGDDGLTRVDSLRAAPGAEGDRFLVSRALPVDEYRVRVTHAGYLAWEIANLAAGGSGSGCTGPNVRELRAALEPAAGG